MRDRAKIIVNNREVGKRYLGSRLVWEAVKKTTERLLRTIRVRSLFGFSLVLTIYTSDKNTPTLLNFIKIQADNKPPIVLDIKVANVKENEVVLFLKNEDERKRVENYVRGATVVKFYGE